MTILIYERALLSLALTGADDVVGLEVSASGRRTDAGFASGLLRAWDADQHTLAGNSDLQESEAHAGNRVSFSGGDGQDGAW
jgi:hypothetical protein